MFAFAVSMDHEFVFCCVLLGVFGLGLYDLCQDAYRHLRVLFLLNALVRSEGHRFWRKFFFSVFDRMPCYALSFSRKGLATK